MSKLGINIYVTPMSVTEIEPPLKAGVLVPVRTGIVHPDAVIKVWRTRSASTSGRFDQIQHAIQVAVQNVGLSVAALRNERPSRKSRKPPKREIDARARTANMFEEKG